MKTMPKPIVIPALMLFLIVAAFSGGSFDALADQKCYTTPVVTDITLKVTGASLKREKKLREMARKMIRITPGDCYTDEAMKTTIELLKQTGQFSAIKIPDRRWEGRSTDLIFHLAAAPLVSKITVKNAFPVFKDEVIDKTGFRMGKAFDPGSLKKDKQSIKTLLNENGYINPTVDIQAAKMPDSGISVLISLKKDDYYKVTELNFNGNRSFSDIRLKLGLKSYKLPLFWGEAKRFIEKDLEKDLKSLTAFYRKKGYVEASVSHELQKNEAQNTVGILFNIDEGPKYKVSITGNREFFKFTLKKDLVLFKKGNINGFGLKRSVKNIRKRYLNAGYPDASVSFETGLEEHRKGSVKTVTIVIKEGRRHLVNSTVIKGEERIKYTELEPEILTRKKSFLHDGPFVEKKFLNDTKAIKNYYAGRGFEGTAVTADIIPLKTDEVDVRYSDVLFTITEGEQKTVKEVTITGASAISRETLEKAIMTKPGMPFLTDTVRRDRMTLLSLFSEKGFLYAEVTPEIITQEKATGKSCSVLFTIQENSPVKTGGSWFFGNFRTDDPVLSNYNDIPLNDAVSLKTVVESQKTIRDINCLKRADFKTIGIKERLDQLFFIAEVEEKKPYYLEADMGYDTARDAYLSLSAGDRNFFGKNRELFLSLDYSGIGYSAEMGLKGFDFLSKRIKSQFSLYGSEAEEKNQNFGSRTYGAQMEFDKAFYKHLTAGVVFSLESREQYPVDDTQAGSDQLFSPRQVIFASHFITWNTVDSFVRPSRGLFINAGAEYNLDIKEGLDHFIKYRAKVKYYKKIHPRIILACQGMAGYIQNLGRNQELPDDQLFFLGGISDVRGFDENELILDSSGDPAGGKTQISASLEARINLGMNVELPLFVDIGSLKETGQSDEDVKVTLGSGLRYMTPVGPVGILYGYRLNKKEGDDTGRIHFSIGYTF